MRGRISKHDTIWRGTAYPRPVTRDPLPFPHFFSQARWPDFKARGLATEAREPKFQIELFAPDQILGNLNLISYFLTLFSEERDPST